MFTSSIDKHLLKEPWNKGNLIGQKAPLKVSDVWAIRVRLQISHRIRELAMFNLAIDSKLRACDLVKLKVRDISHGTQLLHRATVMQQKTHQPVQFEITPLTEAHMGKNNWDSMFIAGLLRQEVLVWLFDRFNQQGRVEDAPLCPQ